MTREGALLITVGVGVLVVALLGWAWRRRTRRDAGWSAPFGDLPAGAEVAASFPVLYVATTRHGEPLERLAVRGLGFRSRGEVRVASAGVAIGLTGQAPIFLPAARVTAVAQATVAIDRVVERDGLVRVSWLIDHDTTVDSYFRPQDASARALADALGALLPKNKTGHDA